MSLADLTVTSRSFTAVALVEDCVQRFFLALYDKLFATDLRPRLEGYR
ncbi:TPA: hypothetical protein ACXIGV_004989 [Pseudomonas aeruginosa]